MKKKTKILIPILSVISLLLVFFLIYLQFPFTIGVSCSGEDNSHFMKNIYDSNPSFGEVSINKIAMLGSHDAFTNKIDYFSKADSSEPDCLSNKWYAKSLARGLGVRLAKAQYSSPYNQLKCGARYLDIRTSKIDDAYYNCHGLISDTLSNNLMQVLKFLDNNPGEVVILQFLRYLSLEPTNNLSDYISSIKYNNKNLYDYILYNVGDFDSVGFDNLTYNTLTNHSSSSGVILISNFSIGGNYSSKFFSSNRIYRDSSNDYSISRTLNNLDNIPETYSSYYNKYLRIVQAQMTPNESHIFDIVKGYSLLNIADQINSISLEKGYLNDLLPYTPIYQCDFVTTMKNKFNKRALSLMKNYNISLVNN